MRITTRGRYGLRAIVHLALSKSDKPLSVRQISLGEKISPEFLEQLLFRLRQSGIVDSVRGPGGGFKLNRSPNDITAKEVFRAVGEEISLTPCTSENEDLLPCERENGCIMVGVWRDASRHINDYFGSMTIRDIIEKHAEI